MNLTELRQALKEKGDEFHMDQRLPEEVARRGKRRVGASASRAAAAVALLLVGGLVLSQLKPPDAADTVKVPLETTLVDYTNDGQDGKGRASQLPRSEVDDHVQCMRRHGFSLPDPEREGDGWKIDVDPESLDFDSPTWREAAFVDCRPMPPPGPGDLILGVPIPRPDIDSFSSCMRVEGFELPEPTPAPNDGWIFELSDSGIDFGSDEWNRAVFVTCWDERWPPD